MPRRRKGNGQVAKEEGIMHDKEAKSWRELAENHAKIIKRLEEEAQTKQRIIRILTAIVEQHWGWIEEKQDS